MPNACAQVRAVATNPRSHSHPLRLPSAVLPIAVRLAISASHAQDSGFKDLEPPPNMIFCGWSSCLVFGSRIEARLSVPFRAPFRP